MERQGTLKTRDLFTHGMCGVREDLCRRSVRESHVTAEHCIAGPNLRSVGLGEPDDVQKEERADNGCNQQTDDTSARNAEQTEYPDADEGAYYPDDQITDKTKP